MLTQPATEYEPVIRSSGPRFEKPGPTFFAVKFEVDLKRNDNGSKAELEFQGPYSLSL